MESAVSQGLLEAMELANRRLDEIKSGVNVYLEKKRLFFPRFFFLSNNEMLQILSETTNPFNVQPHLKKCFEGIHRLEFDEALNIHSMNSSCGEKVNFVQNVSTLVARGCVEKWLLSTEVQMLKAIENETTNSYSDFITTDRCQWVSNWPQMVVLCISQIFWTSDVHTSLQNDDKIGLKILLEAIESSVDDGVASILSPEASNLDRITFRSLIVTDIHARDVVVELMRKEALSINDFSWVAQLRYYWIDGKVSIRIMNTDLKFGNEYLGNSDRLVCCILCTTID